MLAYNIFDSLQVLKFLIDEENEIEQNWTIFLYLLFITPGILLINVKLYTRPQMLYTLCRIVFNIADVSVSFSKCIKMGGGWDKMFAIEHKLYLGFISFINVHEK
jgi:hypothetical protein